MRNVNFAEELARVLPPEVPHRDDLIQKSARHLELIAAANEYMNLTRISNPRDAAIKHVLDCVLPWRHFQHTRRVLDAGTGAGFPGIPLSIVLPEVCFMLAESTQKKARFVDSVIEELGLSNVEVTAERGEAVTRLRSYDVITARAVAPLDRLLHSFATAVERGARLLLYKGPDAAAELAGVNTKRASAEIVERYELPEGCGVRTLVHVSRRERRSRQAEASRQ